MVDFEKGDLVRLKSGGPKMTVLGLANIPRMAKDSTNGKYLGMVYDREVVVCTWFDSKGSVQKDNFDPDILIQV